VRTIIDCLIAAIAVRELTPISHADVDFRRAGPAHPVQGSPCRPLNVRGRPHLVHPQAIRCGDEPAPWEGAPVTGADARAEKARLVVITGLPGSGKTTLALELAQDIRPASLGAP